MSAISAASVSPSSSPIPGIVTSSRTGRRRARSGELLLDRRDPPVEISITGEQRRDRLSQTAGTPRSASSSSAPGLRSARQAHAQPPLRQQSEHAVHRRGAQANQMRAPAETLSQLAILERRDPQRGHQVAAHELGEHARVDPVGLARQRRDRLDLPRVRDLELPAAARSRSRTQTAPLIISTHPRTSGPSVCTSLARPSSSAGIVPSTSSPRSSTAHHAALRVPQSIPRYCMRASCVRKSLLPKRRFFAGGPTSPQAARPAAFMTVVLFDQQRAGDADQRRRRWGRCRRRRCVGQSLC